MACFVTKFVVLRWIPVVALFVALYFRTYEVISVKDGLLVYTRFDNWGRSRQLLLRVSTRFISESHVEFSGCPGKHSHPAKMFITLSDGKTFALEPFSGKMGGAEYETCESVRAGLERGNYQFGQQLAGHASLDVISRRRDGGVPMRL